MDELQFYIMITLACLAAVIIMSILRRVNCCSKRARHWFRDVVHFVVGSVFWNWTIRILQVMYIQLCLTNFNQIRLWNKDSVHQSKNAMTFTVLICILQVLILLAVSFFLIRGRFFLDHPGIFKRISNLYEGIHLYKNFKNIWYMPIFMLRRLVFVSIPLTFSGYQWLQLQFLITLNFIYFVWYVDLSPHGDRTRVRLEIFNECCIMIIVYHMITFSEFNLDPETMFMMGYSYIGFVLILVVGNITFLVEKELDR
jgi:hypothetical protein